MSSLPPAPDSGPAVSPLVSRLDVEMAAALPAMDLDWAQKLALNSFYPVLRARIAQNEAAAVKAGREFCAMIARIGGFSLAGLASSDELAAELVERRHSQT